MYRHAPSPFVAPLPSCGSGVPSSSAYRGPRFPPRSLKSSVPPAARITKGNLGRYSFAPLLRRSKLLPVARSTLVAWPAVTIGTPVASTPPARIPLETFALAIPESLCPGAGTLESTRPAGSGDPQHHKKDTQTQELPYFPGTETECVACRSF